MITCFLVYFIFSAPEPSISGDGLKLTISGKGTVTKEISSKTGDKSKITQVEIIDATSLDDRAFMDFSEMTDIKLPDEMESIGTECFYKCAKLKYVKIPEGVSQINSGTFFYCHNLEKISLPLSLRTISMSSTFCSTHSLKHYDISRDHEYFSTDSSNSYLMSFDKTILYKGPSSKIQRIPSTVKTIVTHYSYGCSLQGISFEGSSLEEIQSSAFVSENLDLFEPPNTLLRIYNNFFVGSIKKLVIPDSVVFLHQDPFASITMEELEFGPDSKVLVNVSGVIYDKNKTIIHFVPSTIDRIEISEKLTSISNKNIIAHNIKWVEVDNKSKTFSSYEGVLYNQTQSILVACPGGLESVVLSPKCKTINNEAFLECLVTKIELNDGLENINFHAFGGCVGLTEMSIPGTVKNLGDWTFSSCKNLKFSNPFSSNLKEILSSCFYDAIVGTVDFSQCNFTSIPVDCFYDSKISTIIFPSKLTRIDSSAFANCKFLTNVSFPDCVDFIGENSFKDCISLNNIIFQGELLQSIQRSAFEHIGVETINIPSHVEDISPGAFRNCIKLNKVTFKDNSSLTRIGFDIINGCKALQEFVIPKSVNYIEPGAFSGSIGLLNFRVKSENSMYHDQNGVLFYKNKEVLVAFPGGRNLSTIASNVIGIESMAFRECKNLEIITFQHSKLIDKISSYTFYGCSKLESIELPGSIKVLEVESFSGCSNLKHVIFSDDSLLCNLSSKVFSGCVSLKSVRFKGQSLLSNIDDSAFEGCVSLGYINLVNISNIGAKAFYNCQSLTSFTLPKSILYVGPLAFGNCSSLIHLDICSRNNTVTFSPDCFLGSKLVEIHVPFEYVPSQINSIPVIRILDDNCNIPTLQFSQVIGYSNTSFASAACFLSCMSER